MYFPQQFLRFLASIGREPKPAENNITFANGSIDENAVMAEAKGLFEYVGDCSETVSYSSTLPFHF